MRGERELKSVLDKAIDVSGGTMPLAILAGSEEEAEKLRQMMKGRRGVKALTVRVASGEELQPNPHWR